MLYCNSCKVLYLIFDNSGELFALLLLKSTVINMSRGHKDLGEIRETLVIMEREDRRVIEDSLVCRVFLDLQ